MAGPVAGRGTTGLGTWPKNSALILIDLTGGGQIREDGERRVNFYHRFFSKYAIRIHGGRATSVKGRMTSSKLRELEKICRETGVQKGEIWSNGVDRVTFSAGIPDAIHQLLRNCIFEIWR
jgi:hypothetical protein